MTPAEQRLADEKYVLGVLLDSPSDYAMEMLEARRIRFQEPDLLLVSQSLWECLDSGDDFGYWDVADRLPDHLKNKPIRLVCGFAIYAAFHQSLSRLLDVDRRSTHRVTVAYPHRRHQ